MEPRRVRDGDDPATYDDGEAAQLELERAGYAATTRGVNGLSMSPKRDQVIQFLEKDPSRAYCADCLRQALELSPVDVTMSTVNLADTRDDRVEVGLGWCSECRRRDQVVRARIA